MICACLVPARMATGFGVSAASVLTGSASGCGIALRGALVAATVETALLQRVLETHVREQLDALADFRVSLG